MISNRNTIEQRILEAYLRIDWDSEAICYPETPLYDYVAAWHELSQYYTHQSDNDIGIEVMGSYFSITHSLSVLSVSPNLNEEYREDAKEAVGEIKMHMEDILNTVYGRLHPNE